MWKHEKVKVLQSIEGELVNNTSKWTEIDEHITKDSKTIKKVGNNPAYSEEERKLYRDRLDDLNIEQQARFEILSQN